MTRPRSRAPSPAGPVYRRSRLLLPILVAAAVSACIGGETPAAPAVSPVASASVTVATSAPPSASPSSVPTAEPAATPTVGPSGGASPSTDASPTASAAAGAGSVEDCTGTDDNRTFFASAAGDLDWPVYCAELPARWFVIAGSYSRASGGKLEISYKGPNNTKLELREGAFCTEPDGCVPPGDDAGSASFGDQSATLVHLDDGRVAAVVDRGEQLSWVAIGDGLGDAAFRSITAALVRLD